MILLIRITKTQMLLQTPDGNPREGNTPTTHPNRKQKSPGLQSTNQPALAIFDVFKAHRSEKVLEKLNAAGIRVVFVPASCTDRLQPLDQLPNKVFKDELKNCFQTYYAEAVAKRRKLKTSGESSNHVDLRTSIIKPLQLNGLSKHSKRSLRTKKCLLNHLTLWALKGNVLTDQLINYN